MQLPQHYCVGCCLPICAESGSAPAIKFVQRTMLPLCLFLFLAEHVHHMQHCCCHRVRPLHRSRCSALLWQASLYTTDIQQATVDIGELAGPIFQGSVGQQFPSGQVRVDSKVHHLLKLALHTECV